MAELNGVRLIVESCGPTKTRAGLFGCNVRLENNAGRSLTYAHESAIIFVDDKETSYGLDSSGTTFNTYEYSYVEAGETRRGRLVLDQNPSSSISTIQLRLTIAGSDLGTFTVSVDLPYK